MNITARLQEATAPDHEVKSWPDKFEALVSFNDCYTHREIRKKDRDYKVGDIVKANEIRPYVGEYTGRWQRLVIKRVVEPGDRDPEAYGLKDGYCILEYERLVG